MHVNIQNFKCFQKNLQKPEKNQILQLDLRRNKLGDAGVQQLVGALGAGAAAKLERLRLGGNSYGSATEVMLDKGLKCLRSFFQRWIFCKFCSFFEFLWFYVVDFFVEAFKSESKKPM